MDAAPQVGIVPDTDHRTSLDADPNPHMTADFEAPHWTGDDERLSRPMHIVTAAADAQTPGDVLRRALRAHGECAVGDTFQATAAHGHRVACCWQMVDTRTGVLPLRQPDVPNPWR